MAEVTASNVWFVAIAAIFLPLTGKNGVTTSLSLKCNIKGLDQSMGHL